MCSVVMQTMKGRRDPAFLDTPIEEESGCSVVESATEEGGDDPFAWIWVFGEPSAKVEDDGLVAREVLLPQPRRSPTPLLHLVKAFELSRRPGEVLGKRVQNLN